MQVAERQRIHLPMQGMQEMRDLEEENDPWVLEEEMATHSSILAWKIHGQRNLAGCSSWGCKRAGLNQACTQAC